MSLRVSIPLEQGSVLRRVDRLTSTASQCLNPFGTGQCLTTQKPLVGKSTSGCLNPFGTGQCLTTWTPSRNSALPRLNPFGTGQCLTTVNQSQ